MSPKQGELESWQRPPDDPGETKPCDACPGTLAWDESAEEWYHVESMEKLNRKFASQTGDEEETDD